MKIGRERDRQKKNEFIKGRSVGWKINNNRRTIMRLSRITSLCGRSDCQLFLEKRKLHDAFRTVMHPKERGHSSFSNFSQSHFRL